MSPRLEVEISDKDVKAHASFIASVGGRVKFIGPTTEEFQDSWSQFVSSARTMTATLRSSDLEDSQREVILHGLIDYIGGYLGGLDNLNLEQTRFILADVIDRLLPDIPPQPLKPTPHPKGLRITTTRSGQHLLPSEAIVFMQRFGLDGIKRTNQQIAEAHGISTVTVTSYYNRAARKIIRQREIRNLLTDQY